MSSELSPPAPAAPLFGPWQVEEYLDSGQFGSVYRVVLAASPGAGSFALKLAHTPDDARFEREASLLSRLHHPHVPAFRALGVWSSPSGRCFPFLVMQYVKGKSLYKWAAEQRLTSRAVLRLLAQLARALEATHALGGLHRDVKGDNVRVSPEGHLWLLDFGACAFEGAPPLTEGSIPPGTEPYRSPRLRAFRWLHQEEEGAHYRFVPADDVYALGVTAYKLVTGAYPPVGKASDGFKLDRRRARGALASACPELRDFILRMLSQDSQARGTAAQLAHDMELATSSVGSLADRPLARPPLFEQGYLPAMTHSREQWGPVRWAAVAAGVLGALAGAGSFLLRGESPRVDSTQVSDSEGETQSVGESQDSSAPMSQPPSASRGAGQAMVKKPLEGQRRPPCEAHHVELHGGCWVAVYDIEAGTQRAVPCGASEFAHEGRCYMPNYVPLRKPTSHQR